jgi:hypothetical protein
MLAVIRLTLRPARKKKQDSATGPEASSANRKPHHLHIVRSMIPPTPQSYREQTKFNRILNNNKEI